MSSTYSNSLRVELIGTGDQAGTWSTTTNSNLAYLLDTAIAGYQTVSVTSASQALTYLNGPISTAALNQSVYAMLRLTTTTAANFAVYAPPVSKQYIIYNNSGYTATIYNSTVIGNTTAAGTGIVIADGSRVLVFSDGTNFYKTDAGTVSSVAMSGGTTGLTTAGGPITTSGTFTLAGTLVVANGGTGATTFSSGALLKGAGTGAIATASAADIVGQIGATAVTNAVNLVTTNFSIVESGGNLLIKYGATTIVTISPTGTINAG